MEGFSQAILYLSAQLYLDLVENLCPKKSISNGMKHFLVVLCLFINAVILVSLIFGCVLIHGYREDQIIGIALLILGCALGLFNMIVALYNCNKNEN